MLEDPVDEVAGHGGGVLRLVVEGGDAGIDDGSGFGGGGHVADVNEVQRRFADAENERAALLEADVGGAFDEVCRETMRDACEGSHGAGEDDHAVGGVGAAGDGGTDVFVGEEVDFGGCTTEQFFNEGVAALDCGLFGEDPHGAGG